MSRIFDVTRLTSHTRLARRRAPDNGSGTLCRRCFDGSESSSAMPLPPPAFSNVVGHRHQGRSHLKRRPFFADYAPVGLLLREYGFRDAQPESLTNSVMSPVRHVLA